MADASETIISWFLPVGLVALVGGVGLGLVELYLVHHEMIEQIHDSSIVLLITFGIQTVFMGLLADLIVHRR